MGQASQQQTRNARRISAVSDLVEPLLLVVGPHVQLEVLADNGIQLWVMGPRIQIAAVRMADTKRTHDLAVRRRRPEQQR